MKDFYEGRVMLRGQEVEALLGLQAGMLTHWGRLGIPIPHYLVGQKAKMYDKAEVLAWWEAKRRNGAPTVVNLKDGPTQPTVGLTKGQQRLIKEKGLA